LWLLDKLARPLRDWLLPALPGLVDDAIHLGAPEVTVGIESVVGSTAKTKIAGNSSSTKGVRLDVRKLEAAFLLVAPAANVDEGALHAVALEHLALVGCADVARPLLGYRTGTRPNRQAASLGPKRKFKKIVVVVPLWAGELSVGKPRKASPA